MSEKERRIVMKVVDEATRPLRQMQIAMLALHAVTIPLHIAMRLLYIQKLMLVQATRGAAAATTGETATQNAYTGSINVQNVALATKLRLMRAILAASSVITLGVSLGALAASFAAGAAPTPGGGGTPSFQTAIGQSLTVGRTGLAEVHAGETISRGANINVNLNMNVTGGGGFNWRDIGMTLGDQLRTELRRFTRDIPV